MAGTMCVGRAVGQRLVHGAGRLEPVRLVLREVLHHDLVPLGPRASVGRLGARQHAHQRRLAGAVGPDQRHAVAALDEQRQVPEDHLLGVALADVRQLQHGPAALGALPER